MANYNDDHNESATSGVGNILNTIRENRGLSKIRETQLAIMTSVFEELAETCLRLQPGASPQDFSALSMILQAKRYSDVSSELGMSQTEAVESAERAISIVKNFLTRLTKQRSAAVIAREEYKEQLKMDKERIKVPISYGLQSCLISAGIENLGDVVMLSKQEVAKVSGISTYLRELDALVWQSGLDYHEGA